MERYNIFFVPRLPERKILSKLRRDLCRQLHSRDALRSPVHMSLISGGMTIRDYTALKHDLKELCSAIKPIDLSVGNNIDVLPDISWVGLHITRTPPLKRFQEQLQTIRNMHAKEKQEHYFRPLHITLAHPADVRHINLIRSPFTKLLFDRITICKKYGDIYRIHEHIPLSK